MDGFYSIKIRSLYNYFKSTNSSFWLVCLYLFFEYVRPQSIYPFLQVIPWAQLVLLLLLLFSLHEKSVKWVSNGINKLLVLYFIVILFSSLASYNQALSFSRLDSFYIWFVVYFLIVTNVNTHKKYFIFLILYMLFNFKMSQHGFLSWAMNGFAFRDWGVTGAPGWFHNSGEFGIQLCIFIPLTLYFIYSLQKYWTKPKKAFFYLMPITAFGALLATSSRGALIGISAALIYMLLNSRYKFKSLIGLAILSVILFQALPQESYERLMSSGSDSTSTHRLVLWKIGIDEMNNNPILGVGHGSWERYYRDKYPHIPGTAMTHNLFIQAGTELGYTGLALLILMIVYSFKSNRVVRKISKQYNDQFSYNISLALDASMIGLLISGSFVTVLYYPYIWIHLAFIVSLRNVVENSSNKDSNESQLHPCN